MSVVQLDAVASEFCDKISKKTSSAQEGLMVLPWTWRDKLKFLLALKLSRLSRYL